MEKQTWIENEFRDIQFGDARLNRRFMSVVEQLAKNAGNSIQLACEDWASVKAAYRLFSNPKIDATQIVRSHIEATQRRAHAEKTDPILVIQDTTYLNYSHHPSTKGLGEISAFKDRVTEGRHLRAYGLMLHSSLALNTKGIPLGLLDQRLWTRSKPIGLITRSKKNMTRIPIRQKESFRWIEAIRHVSKRVDPSRIVHLGDREADIFDFFYESSRCRTNFVIRLRDEQRHIEPKVGIFKPLRSSPLKGTFEVVVRNKNGIPRSAKLEVRFYPVKVLPPAATKTKRYPVRAYVISAIEVGTPRGEERIDWKLLTNLEVHTFEQALEKISWYTLRWHIEVYHKVLKSGCRVLDCKLRTADRLLRYVAVMTVVAWRIFWMSWVSRSTPNLRPEVVVTSDEKRALKYLCAQKQIHVGNHVYDHVRAIARLGGFLARKSDGDPGPLVLWRGYLRLYDILLGFTLAPTSRCG